MPNIDLWLESDVTSVMSAETRAALAWRRISDRPTQIVVTRTRNQLAAQTVRVEWDNTATDRFNAATNAVTVIQKATVFGIRDHASLPDTDIRRSDRFLIEGVNYEVKALLLPPGEVQALCEATGAT